MAFSCAISCSYSAAAGICLLLSQVDDDNNPFAMAVFILAVVVIASHTDGYWYGIFSAIAGVLCANYAFTKPFFQFEWSIAGYPLTFTAMLLVSLIVSTLTTQIKKQEQLRFDVETEKMRVNLLRSLSHDLRTPLTLILSPLQEIREHGIRVTAVCPAGVATDLYGLTPRWQRIGTRLGVLITADSCARRGLRALWRGRRCIVPDWWNRVWIPLCKILPMWVLRPVRKFTMKFQK